ncbi:hypothetical protein ACM43_09550 [Bradyrhizobium sp. CCBAU 45321]|uniref:hypothetical protein n=1 Tax=Bradyrhizobium TaxID=374 RepID=UPI00055E8494|nr:MULTISPECIES: hypothetical protein [Bradyrhizobium]MDA9544781.1 hypothetical protein [Bradyrhizobium sp. CCBAU 45321]
MPKTIREQLDEVEREVTLYNEFDEAEKARFKLECFLWTAEERIEWQETQRSIAEHLRELTTSARLCLTSLKDDFVTDAQIERARRCLVSNETAETERPRAYTD